MVKSEISQRTVDLETLKDKYDRQREELEILTTERHSLEGGVSGLRKEKLSLEEMQRLSEKRLKQLQRYVTHTHII